MIKIKKFCYQLAVNMLSTKAVNISTYKYLFILPFCRKYCLKWTLYLSSLAHILPNPLCNKCILNCSYLNSIIIIMKFLHFIHCVSTVVRQHLFRGNEANTHGIKFGGQFISVKAVIKMKTEKNNELCLFSWPWILPWMVLLYNMHSCSWLPFLRTAKASKFWR